MPATPPSSTYTGGEALVSALLSHGIDTIFGLPGVQNDYFYNAVYDAGDKLRVIHSRHEQGAAYMALGYALAGNRVGVYNVVPGPGFLNTTAALSTAYGCNAKVLCLTGQIHTDQIGRGYGMLHEIPDQMAIIRSLTKWAARIQRPQEAPRLLATALSEMLSDRIRPVGLEIPLDVLSAKVEMTLTDLPLTVRRPAVDPDAIERAAQLLGKAKRPLIFVGGGAMDASEEVCALAEALQAPVFATNDGRGILSSHHYLSFATGVAHRFWAEADVVLAVGTRLTSPLLNWGVDDDVQIIRIDIDPEEHNRISPPTVGLAALVNALGKYNSRRASRKEEMETLKATVAGEYGQLQPQMAYLSAIRQALPDDGIFVDELTQVGYVSRYALPVYQPRTFLSTGYQGTLGWGFSTALGAKVAQPDRPVLSVSGDGGFLFGVQEMATAVQHNIATVSIVFDDGAFGNVRRMQQQQYGNRVIASDLCNPDFVKLAEAFGMLGLRANSPDELRAAIEKGFASGAPTLIHAPVGEMPSPWGNVFMPRVRPVKRSA
jgi:acetolactate synthase I/II/III large subunit